MENIWRRKGEVEIIPNYLGTLNVLGAMTNAIQISLLHIFRCREMHRETIKNEADFDIKQLCLESNPEQK